MSRSLNRLSERALRRAGEAVERGLGVVDRHPRLMPGIVLSSLATFGVTAFGVAPVDVQPVLPPYRIVSEDVPALNLGAQRDALASHDTSWYRSSDSRNGDTMAAVFQRLGILDAQALAFATTDAKLKSMFDGRAGKRIRSRTDDDGRLVELVVRMPSREAALATTHFTRLTLRRGGDGLQSLIESVPFGHGVRMASGEVRTTLFAATDAADLPDGVATQITDIFASEIDFHRELRRGDTFRVVYESLTADGEPIGWGSSTGRVLAVEFVNNGRKHEAVWFQRESGSSRGEYYDFKGQSRRKAFLASPLEFSRVTSGFTMRFNPVQQSWRQHLGIDYAATAGTPVRTVGEGTVEFAGTQTGYGNTVVVKHSHNRSTLYAHLSRIDVAQGQAVAQGDRIGAVGSTGWSTGPHLHFEFKVAGEHRDPLVIAATAESVPLTTQDRVAFSAAAETHVHHLKVAATLADARSSD